MIDLNEVRPLGLTGAQPRPSIGEVAERLTGILVALLGRLHPMGVLVAAVFFAALTIGAQSMHGAFGLPIALAQLLQVIVILVVLIADALARRWWQD